MSHKIGQLMSYWILTVSGHVISATTVQRLTNAESQTDEWKAQMETYNKKIKDTLQVADVKLPTNDIDSWNQLPLSILDEDFLEEFNKTISDSSVPHAEDQYTPDSFDGYLNMEVGMPRGPDGELQHVKVKKRAVDDEGRPIGVAHNNPLLDSRQYESNI